jgi:hypothetical protein
MDIGEIFPFRIGMLGQVTHTRPIDGDAVGKVAEGDPHGLDAIAHRQEPLDVVVGNDDSHSGGSRLSRPFDAAATYRRGTGIGNVRPSG